MKQRYCDAVAIGVLLAIACALYLPYLFDKPGFSGDSIKFQAIGPVLGAPHPTGYPLYMGLLWATAKIPISTYAFKANVLSLFFSLASLLLLYASIRRLGASHWTAFSLSAFFASTPAVWSYSCVAEVYSLHWFLMLLFLRIAYEWQQAPTPRRFLFLLLILTLSFLHHLLTITLLPAFLLFLFLNRPKWPRVKRVLLAIAISLFVFVGVHALFYLRLQMEPPYMDGGELDVRGYVSYVMGGGYRTLLFADETMLSWIQKCGALCLRLAQEWSWPALIIALVAAAANVRAAIQYRRSELLLLASLLTWFIICGPYDIADIDQYFPHALILVLLLIAHRLPTCFKNHQKFYVPLLSLVVVCFVGFRWTAPPQELVKYRASQPQPIQEMLRQVPNDSILDAGFYTYEQLFNYYRMEQNRFDVKPFILPQFAAQTFNYIVYGVPLSARGETIPAGRRAFTFSDIAAYQRLGLQVQRIYSPTNSPLNETFFERLQKTAQGKSVFIAGSPSLVASDRLNWANAFQRLGIQISQEDMNQKCVIAYHPNFGTESEGFVVKRDFESIEVAPPRSRAKLVSHKTEGGYLSYVELQDVRFGDYQEGYTFVIADSWGAVQAFTIDPMYGVRVFPYDLVEVLKPAG
ncbi:MAG: DUF2723 domain-containing protein [Candidatus Hinthialibacter antarcticus]|nr:DUF2723 domain-containing protein [Candidatus Hinthialibacter antarcticus]